jgi:juvenile-hormone esterase
MQKNFYQWKMFTTGEEDCLYLNIFRPQHIYEKMPVFVYFPHSDLMYGSGTYYDTAPDQIMQNRVIILVVIQYRVGVLGFLSTGDSNAPGNYGLKDQALGLAWVRQNIASFSGDPNNITVFGDLTVQYQLMRPQISE